MDEPPVDDVYQSIEPALEVALISTVPELHREPELELVIEGDALTVTVLVAVAFEQPPEPVFV